jgi:hypothetical protein
MSNEQHLEDTKYKQWQDGMYVMLDELTDPLDEQGYVLALIEDSLRNSVYFVEGYYFDLLPCRMCLGVHRGSAGAWVANDKLLKLKLTRAQALYIATGDTDM